MITKPFRTSILVLSAAALVAGAIICKALVFPGAVIPAKAGTTGADVSIAAQKVQLTLSDGRVATFTFATSGGTLVAHAAVGLDQECNYALLPLADLPFVPTPAPSPAPSPTPTPVPTPNPPQASNLRVLFTYDPAALADLPAAQQAIVTSPALRSYLEKHCPLESNCRNGQCPLHAVETASYRFLPGTADVSQLPAVWQGIVNAARGKPTPWLLAVDEAGRTVVDQSWPASVDETLALLKKFGGE